MTKRAITYARVSGDDRHKEGRNLASQIDDGRAYCQKRGYRIVAELAEDDRGASGASWDLPMLNQALDMARRGEFDILVTRELDRLARGLAKQLVIEGEFKRHGVEIEYILGEYDDSPEGQLNKNIRAVIAEFEREKINQRMTRGRRNIVKAGKVMLHGNKPPYGYHVQDKELVIYEPEARIVTLIYTWYVQGDERLSIKAIARRLTGMRIPTRTDHSGGYKKRGRGEWSEGTVSDMLSNESYAGTWHYGKRDKESRHNPRDTWLSVEVPAIVSREVWERAQKRKIRNRELATRNSKYEYLLGRRVSCGQCNKFKMFGKAVQGGKYKYYCCPGTRRGSCDQGYFPVLQVDGAVWQWIRGLLLDPEHLRQELEEQRERLKQDIAPLHDRVVVIDDLLADKRGQLEKLLDLYLAGDFPRDVLTEKKLRLESLIASLEGERQAVTYAARQRLLSDKDIKTIEDMARKLSGELEVADVDFAARRQLIDTLDCRARLAVENGRKVAHVKCIIRPEETLSIEDATTRNAWPET